ncbi:hypothetical protein PFISCL1PPCAC_4433, partial [Pristionchus fissidentatus]
LKIQSINQNTVQSQPKPLPPLPPMRIETFDGADITKWQSFISLYETLIHSRTDLTDLEKLGYLKSSLKGDALELVQSIPITDAFLSHTLDRLKSEYARSTLTHATLMSQLMNIKPKSSKLEDQLKCVRSTINTVYALNDDVSINVMPIIHQVVQRIHTKYIRVIHEFKPESMLKALMHIEEKINTELEIRAVEHAYSFNNNPINSPSANNNPNSSFAASSKSKPSLQPKPAKASSPSKPMCAFCGEHEFSATCTKFPDAKSRKEILQRKKLCIGCLSAKHSTTECTRKCANCDGKHHKTVCFQSSSSATASTIPAQSSVRLYSGPLCIQNATQSISLSAFALFDKGSMITMITRELSDRLKLTPIDRRTTTIVGVEGRSSDSTTCDVVRFDVMTTNGKVTIQAIVRDNPLLVPIQYQPLSSDDLAVMKQRLPFIPVHFEKPVPVCHDILLSIADSEQILNQTYKYQLPSGYTLVESSVGPFVIGCQSNTIQNTNVSASTTLVDPSLEDSIRHFLAVDSASRVYETTEKEARKAKDAMVQQHFDETVVKVDNEYYVQYSVKPEASTMIPDNFELAISRLASNVKSLQKTKGHIEFHDSIIADQLKAGQIEIVNPIEPVLGITHYLAHQSVLRPDKPTTPLRIVYDASAHIKNKPSLNDLIHPGPSDLEQIPALLIRARSRKTLIIADVEKAFLQVKLQESQRDMLRFLWVKDLNKPACRSNLRYFRFCVTPFGVNQSPFLLNSVITHHIREHGKNCDPDLVHQLTTNLYVDNIIINHDNPSDILYPQSKELFNSMHMNLRDYASNNNSFLDTIQQSDRASGETQKLLGLVWMPSNDTLQIKIPLSARKDKETKRSMLSAVSSPYDPLGLIAPLLLPSKLLVQSLWNEERKWDEPVDDSISDTFHSQMTEIEKFSLPVDRYSKLSSSKTIHIVMFSDASKSSMAACLYSWTENSDPMLLISRTRLAPISGKSTIPKMELDAFLMGHSVLQYTIEAIKKEFPESMIHVYTYCDSATVLHWCRQEKSKSLGTFVFNRIHSIFPTVEPLLKLESFSSLRVPVTVTAYVLRFLSRIANKCKSDSIRAKFSSIPLSTVTHLTAEEKKYAFRTLLRNFQQRHISDYDEVVKKNHIFLDESTDLWKATSRLENSNISTEFKNPIFIPTKNSILARLIVRDTHDSTVHAGVQTVINQIQSQFWIPRIRQITKSVLHSCIPCHKTNNLPYSYPKSPALPADRVNPSRPFEHTGVDYAGPFQSNNNSKMYIVLFTCMSSRLSHIELVDSLLPSSFIMAFRRFSSRRGVPSRMTSDKATTLKMASTLLSSEARQKEYIAHLRDSNSRSDPLQTSRSTFQTPKPGSVVLVVDESGTTPRSSWHMAKILAVTNNSATLKSHNGRTIERPINLLIPLELDAAEETETPIEVHTNHRHAMTTRS